MAAQKKSGNNPAGGGVTSDFVPKYLFAYNLVQLVGWCYVTHLFISYCASEESFNAVKLWQNVFAPVAILQLFALVEILHAIIGIVNANPLITALQLLSRVFNTFFVFSLIPPHMASIGIAMTLFAWCGAEITRFAFHIFKEINYVPYVILWIRYSAFMILIPTGISGELLGQYVVQSLYANKWNFVLPVINITVGYRHFIILVMLSAAQGILAMYKHMFALRRKALSKSATAKFE